MTPTVNMAWNAVPDWAPTLKFVCSSSGIVLKGSAWFTTERKDV